MKLYFITPALILLLTNMKNVKVFIILINWNNYKDTVKCITSLNTLKKSNIEITTVVIDNASTDNSVIILQKEFPTLKIIALPNNEGFTGGNNRGIDYARKHDADYVWFLNNDTVVHPGALVELLHSFQDPSVGIAGSKIYFMKHFEFHKKRYKQSELGKVIWYAGGNIDWNNVYGSHRGVDEVDNGQYDVEEETDFVTGCSLMISTVCLDIVKGFDSKYFAFLEDMDLCLKIRNAGYKIMYNPQSLVWHKNAGSTGGPGNKIHQYYMTRNRLLFGFRYASFRTKLALIKEAFHQYKKGNSIQKRAIVDALIGKWGKDKHSTL